MIGWPVKYVDFNDEEQNEVHWFHLSKPELIEVEVEVEGGLANFVKQITKAENGREIIMQFKDIVLRAYGQRTPDGKRFIKNDTLKEEFVQSAAYHHLFMELATDAAKAAEFLKGTLPKDLVGDIDKALAELPKEAAAPPATT